MNEKIIAMTGAVLFFGISSVVMAQEGQIGRANAIADGMTTRLVIDGQSGSGTYCGIRVNWGDGTTSDVKIDSHNGVFPREVTRTYKRMGTYKIKVEGAKVTTHMPCSGFAETVVKVDGSRAAHRRDDSRGDDRRGDDRRGDDRRGDDRRHAGDRRGDRWDNLCPPGWELKASPNATTGAFSCKVSTPPPIDCGKGLTYVRTKDSVGCQVKRR